MITWSESEEVLRDVEINLNDRPLTYIDEDLENSVRIPNSMILGRDIKLPDDSPEDDDFSDNWNMYINAKQQLGKDGFLNTW